MLQNFDKIGYSELVGILDERNRCSGGIKSIHEVIINSRINDESKVLEIGSNTGFTSINIAYLSKSKVTGIDINETSVAMARKYASRNGLDHLVNFVVSSAENLPFPDELFDLVWASNVTSFISNKTKAVEEYLRVLKVGGTLSLIPIYYTKTPPDHLVDSVSKAIGAEIIIRNKENWKAFVEKGSSELGLSLELYYEKDFQYLDASDKIDEYVEMQISKPHLKKLNKTQLSVLEEKARYFYNLFNENLKYCGFSILLYQKRNEMDEKELFLTKSVVI